MWFQKYMTAPKREENDGEGSDLGGGVTTEEIEELNPDAEAFEALAAEMDEDNPAPISIEENSEVVEESNDPAEEAVNEEEIAEASESQEPAEEDEPQKPSAEEESQSPAEEEESVEVEETSEAPTLEQYEAQRTKTIDEVAKLYAFTDEEDINRLRTNPEEVLPELAAEMFYDIHQAVMQSVMGMFPQLMDQHTAQATAQKAAEDSFYTQWPMLNDAKYKADYQRVGGMYKQLNPKATQEQFNREVGAQLLIAHQIPFNTQTGEIIQQEVVEEITTTPHTPARPSASAPAPAKPQENEFEAFSREFDDD